MTERENEDAEMDVIARAEFHLHVLACLCAAVEMEKVERAANQTDWGDMYEITNESVAHRAVSLAIAVEENLPRIHGGGKNR